MREYGRMSLRMHLTGCRRVVIEREGLAGYLLRRLERVRMPVIGVFRGRKKDHAVKQRSYFLHAFLPVPAPELQMASPLFLPALIEVDEDIKAAIEAEALVLIEVDVDA